MGDFGPGMWRATIAGESTLRDKRGQLITGTTCNLITAEEGKYILQECLKYYTAPTS